MRESVGVRRMDICWQVEGTRRGEDETAISARIRMLMLVLVYTSVCSSHNVQVTGRGCGGIMPSVIRSRLCWDLPLHRGYKTNVVSAAAFIIILP